MKTPNLDRLAAKEWSLQMAMQPVRFWQSLHAPSILTGKFGLANHGITDWIGAPKEQTGDHIKRFFKLLPAN